MARCYVNRRAWDREVERDNPWTRPVDGEAIAAARAGNWNVVLTPTKPVPRDWFGDDIAGKKVLCLASGGGQQAPLLAAAGFTITGFYEDLHPGHPLAEWAPTMIATRAVKGKKRK